MVKFKVKLSDSMWNDVIEYDGVLCRKVVGDWVAPTLQPHLINN